MDATPACCDDHDHPPRAQSIGRDSIVVTSHTSGIIRIFDRDINAVILRRPPDAAVAAEVAALGGDERPATKLVVEARDDARAALHGGLGLPRALTNDIAFWVGVMSDLCDVPLVGVRLAHEAKAMCPRFHVDRVLLRLVIAYAGEGTEMISEGQVNRSKLSPHHGGLPDETSGLLREGGTIARAQTGDVVIMKGELWDSDVGGIVHRSPRPASTRWLLTLDPLG